eukprot:gene27022-2249_t
MLRIYARTLAAGAVAAGSYLSYEAFGNVQRQFDLASQAGNILRTVLDPETAHNLGISVAKAGLFPKETRPDDPILKTTVFGKEFRNPLGLAAGFDKHAEIMEAMLGMGFGFVEVGSITPKPQPGNPKPRVFRIPEHKAVVNRYGFNSVGSDVASDNLATFSHNVSKNPEIKTGPVGVNLGKNKTSVDAAQDYSISVSLLSKFADYLVINVSSPNTPGLRALQSRKELETIVVQVLGTRNRMLWGPQGPPPLLIKIAPDLNDQDLADIAAVVKKHKVDGLIVSNTTITRPGDITTHPVGAEAGGLSGPPVFEISTNVLLQVYELTGGQVPLIGCASLVQLYTALAYEGPALVPRVKAELAACLRRDGFSSVAEAVGADHKPKVKKGGWLW